MDYEEAKAIASKGLKFGDPRSIEAVRIIEHVRRMEASDPGFGIEVTILKNHNTGEKRTRYRLVD